MSKAVKQSLAILALLLIVAVGFAFYSMTEAQKAKDEGVRLNSELTQAQTREKKSILEIKTLKDQVEQLTAEKEKLDEKVKKAEKSSEDLYNQITEISEDRDKWKGQIDQITKQRDDLLGKVKDLNDQIAEKEVELSKQAIAKKEETPKPDENLAAVTPTSTMAADQPANTDIWAGVVKDKASIEVKIDELNQELAKKAAEVVELKNANEDLKVKLDSIMHDKDQIDREIKYKSDMVSNLSLELARAKNDKQFAMDNINKLNQENAQLRQQIQQLVTTKGSLEKSILRITQERNQAQAKVGQTETMIKSKIGEIWDIKQNIDQNVRPPEVENMATSRGVELPAIVVSTEGNGVSFNPGMTEAGFSGKVLSVNKENNFAIIDVGEGKGIRIGDSVNVYRGSKLIAKLEVIQVRKDISAADIKNQSSAIQPGDVVR